MASKPPTYHLRNSGPLASCGTTARYPDHAVVPAERFAPMLRGYRHRVCAKCRMQWQRQGAAIPAPPHPGPGR